MIPLAIALFLAPAPERLTNGPGDDTAPAWSPDGSTIAFQRTREGTTGIGLLDLTGGDVTMLLEGSGHSCFPAWSPEGRSLVYASYDETATAQTAADGQAGYHLYVVDVDGGQPRQLTGGRVRDYSPCYNRDGTEIWFTSTRGWESSGAGLFRIPSQGGDPTPVTPPRARDAISVGPDISADGKLLAYGFVAGIRGNWAIHLAKAADPAQVYPITDGQTPFYGPAWAPSGYLLACTGYVPGDPGWGIYVIDALTGARMRLETGPGNARSPCWSPDGKWLAYDSNATGHYRLYRIEAPVAVSLPAALEASTPPGNDDRVAWYAFDRAPSGTVVDRSPRGNDATVTGSPEHGDAGWLFGPGAFLSVPGATGLDFGTGAFSVKAVVQLDRHTGELRHIAVGQYPDNSLGWQLYVDKENRAWFNSRDTSKQYKGARSDGPLPLKRPVTLVGVRRATGGVRLYVDGLLQSSVASGATISYPAPVQLRIGSQFNGTSPFGGWIRELVIYRRELLPSELQRTSLAEFIDG